MQAIAPLPGLIFVRMFCQPFCFPHYRKCEIMTYNANPKITEDVLDVLFRFCGYYSVKNAVYFSLRHRNGNCYHMGCLRSHYGDEDNWFSTQFSKSNVGKRTNVAIRREASASKQVEVGTSTRYSVSAVFDCFSKNCSLFLLSNLLQPLKKTLNLSEEQTEALQRLRKHQKGTSRVGFLSKTFFSVCHSQLKRWIKKILSVKVTVC